MTIPTLARNAAMILRDGDINDESDRARFRAVKAELASLLPEGVDVSLVIEREVWGDAVPARATHASHRARILGLGLSVGIAIACVTLPAVPAEARGMYCTRHPEACRERRAADAIRNELARQKEEQFQAGLKERLTDGQYQEVSRREADWATAYTNLSANSDAELAAVRAENARLSGRPTWLVAWIMAVVGSIVGVLAAAFVQSERTGA